MLRIAKGRKQTTPSGIVTAMPWIGVPVTTPRRAATLLSAKVAADSTASTAPSICVPPLQARSDAAEAGGRLASGAREMGQHPQRGAHATRKSASSPSQKCRRNFLMSATRARRRSFARESRSVAHMAPIGLPEAAHAGLGGACFLAFRCPAAHLDDRHLVAGRGNAALHEADDAAVFHGHQARGADQV